MSNPTLQPVQPNRSSMTWTNDFTKQLGIEFPIVQAPMLGVTSPQMVAQLSNAGALGSLPVGGLSPDKTLALIRQTKTLTRKPFAVNLFANTLPTPRAAQASQMREFLTTLARNHNLAAPTADALDTPMYSYADQLDILVSEKISVISFTFGIPDDASLKTLKSTGAVLIGTATSFREAAVLQEKGVDMITAQGIEAGGHRGSFLDDEPLPQVGLISLVSEIVHRLPRPVLAAGGIHDGKTIRAALMLGAQAVQIGTAFIACTESIAIPSYKSAVMNATGTDTALTRAFTGRWARGIRNAFMNEVENSGIAPLPYPLQASLNAALRASAQQRDDKEFTNLWAGQSTVNVQAKPAVEILQQLIQEAEAV
nr:nitronate monooxygenase [Chryseolinea lacunae]